MSELILWSYDASPFTQRALRLLGIKNLPWHWVETPMMPPKDDLVALTGGYRGTPVLQIGADVYIDSQRIALELERRFPHPTLFPDGCFGTPLMLVRWADAFFRNGLVISVQLLGAQWPEPFMADRRYLFVGFDWESALSDSSHARSQLRAHAALLENQLSDGRKFLAGDRPGLADAHAHPFVWMAQAYFPDVARALFAGFRKLQEWFDRVAALGEGSRKPMDAQRALEIARSSQASVEPRTIHRIRWSSKRARW
jgi:glutathione S-transferase